MIKAKKGSFGSIVSDFLSIIFTRKLPRVSLVIPAYNEEKTIARVIKQAKKVEEIKEIIVIDDGSIDKTSKIARELGVEVIKHHKNLGKGEAIKTGIEHSNYPILLFIDADLKNIEPKKIRALIRPIIINKADFTKGSFGLKRGRVTEFAVKPMMKVLYPKNEFKQPISGQFAGKKQFLKNITIESKWGIDISILLDAIKQGQRVVEVNLGVLEHKSRTPEEKAEMSKEIMETILKKVGFLCSKHKVIFFTDNTLFSKGFTENSKKFLEVLSKKKMRIVYITTKELKNFGEHKKYIDLIEIINPKEKSGELKAIVKRIAKRYGVTLQESVLFANVRYFKPITKKVGLSLCFTNSPEELKENCRIMHSLSDAFLFLE